MESNLKELIYSLTDQLDDWDLLWYSIEELSTGELAE